MDESARLESSLLHNLLILHKFQSLTRRNLSQFEYWVDRVWTWMKSEREWVISEWPDVQVQSLYIQLGVKLRVEGWGWAATNLWLKVGLSTELGKPDNILFHANWKLPFKWLHLCEWMAIKQKGREDAETCLSLSLTVCKPWKPLLFICRLHLKPFLSFLQPDTVQVVQDLHANWLQSIFHLFKMQISTLTFCEQVT